MLRHRLDDRRAARARARRCRTAPGRGTRLGIGAALLAVAAVAGYFVGPAAAGRRRSTARVVARSTSSRPIDIAAYPSPLAGFRKYTEPNRRQALRHRPLLHGHRACRPGTPVRFATLDSYDGGVVGRGLDRRRRPDSPDPGAAFQQVGERVSARGAGQAGDVQVTVPEGGYADVWLPTVGTVTGVKFAGGPGRPAGVDGCGSTSTPTPRIVPDKRRRGRPLHHARAPADQGRAGHPPGVVVAGQRQPRREPGARLPRRQGRRLDRRRREPVGGAASPSPSAMRSDGAYTDGGTKNSVESYYLPGHRVGRLARFVGVTQLAGNDEQYAATLALVANRLGHPDPRRHGRRAARGRRHQGQGRPRLGGGPGRHRQWTRCSPRHFLPDRNKKPNQLQSKSEEQKIGALVPPPAGVNPPSVLQGPDQAQNATNLKKPPKKLFDPSAWPSWLRFLVFYVLLPLLVLVALYWAIRGAQGLAPASARHPGHRDRPGRVGVGRPHGQREVVRSRAAPPGDPARAGRRACTDSRARTPLPCRRTRCLRPRHP